MGGTASNYYDDRVNGYYYVQPRAPVYQEQMQLGYYKPEKSRLHLTNQIFNIKRRKYTLIKYLGGGAFGGVWSAVASDGQPAAVKAIDINRRDGAPFNPTQLIASFDKEVRMAFRMRQETQHVVTIYGFDFDSRRGLALLAMELGGETLKDRINKLHNMKILAKRHHRADGFDRRGGGDGGYISPADRKNIWIQLNGVIQILNKYQVVHRDMKPENFVFFGNYMKIVDLGIAQKEIVALDPNLVGIGTRGYSAPEVFTLRSPVTTKADIWSAGAILYHMTYGGIPPGSESPTVQPITGPPPGVSPTRSTAVAEILDRCIQMNPQQRADHKWLERHAYSTNPSVL